MDNDTVSLRSRAARLRTVFLRAGTMFAALVAIAATPAIAAAHHRHHHHATRHPKARRHTARRHHVHQRVTHKHAAHHKHVTHHKRVTHHKHVTHRHHARRHAASQARTGAPRCIGSHARLGRVSHTATESAVLCLLNVQRGDYGLPVLTGNFRLDSSAQDWTNTMVHDRAFSHGADFAARISAVGFRWSRVGENIADGFGTPAGVVAAWMRSTGHCENILDPQFRDVGAGFETGTAASGMRSTGTWTLDLALGERQRARSGDWTPAEACPH